MSPVWICKNNNNLLIVPLFFLQSSMNNLSNVKPKVELFFIHAELPILSHGQNTSHRFEISTSHQRLFNTYSSAINYNIIRLFTFSNMHKQRIFFMFELTILFDHHHSKNKNLNHFDLSLRQRTCKLKLMLPCPLLPLIESLKGVNILQT